MGGQTDRRNKRKVNYMYKLDNCSLWMNSNKFKKDILKFYKHHLNLEFQLLKQSDCLDDWLFTHYLHHIITNSES